MTSKESLTVLQAATVFKALSNSHRIRVIQVVVDASSSVTLEDLAREIARKEEEPVESTREERVEELHVSLYHKHIPKLEDLGLIEWNRDEGRVAIDDSAPLEQIEISRL